MTLDAKIEAVLFWKAEPISIKKLATIIEASEEETEQALSVLDKKLLDRGLALQRLDRDVVLATSPEFSKLIETLTKEELIKDLGKAGLETLTIIVYQGPISRADIDYVRGVQSQFIVRNLLVRGLIEKIDNPKDQRSYLYKPTFELLSYLGLRTVEEMPDFEKVNNEIKEYKEKALSNEAEQK